ncbi:MAG: hypothetical protein H0T92_14120 [Pyrinomonadaceae bacterium]|nr:hypothetical protein [Pyrinomonadaceae bacterium]
MKQNMWNGETEQGASKLASCEHAESLVTYLYGETSAGEAKIFEQHLERCLACREELAAFSHMRNSIYEWRAQALGIAASFPLDLASPAVSTFANSSAERSEQRGQKHSTLAALRRFFHFSPLWVRAGGVAAVLLVCVLAGIFITNSERGRTTASRVTPLEQANRSPQNTVASPEGESGPESLVRLNTNDESISSDEQRSSSLNHNSAASSGQTTRSRRAQRKPTPSPFAPARDQLLTASNEREVVAREASNLPQLYDLLGEQQMSATDEDTSPRLRDLLRQVK